MAIDKYEPYRVVSPHRYIDEREDRLDLDTLAEGEVYFARFITRSLKNELFAGDFRVRINSIEKLFGNRWNLNSHKKVQMTAVNNAGEPLEGQTESRKAHPDGTIFMGSTASQKTVELFFPDAIGLTDPPADCRGIRQFKPIIESVKFAPLFRTEDGYFMSAIDEQDIFTPDGELRAPIKHDPVSPAPVNGPLITA